MAQSNLEIVIKAQDEASDKLKGIAESAKGMGIAFTAAGAVITGALAFAIKQASDAQIQMQGVDTTLAALKSSAQEAASKVADNGNEMKMSALKAQELQLKISDIEKKYKSSGAALDDNGQSLDKNAIKLAEYKMQLEALNAKQEQQQNLLKLANGNFDSFRETIVKAGKAAIDLGFDDEEASLSITKLFQRTGDLNQAIKLNSLAMDLARSKHMDLATASNLVGMVLSGNSRVLKQYGIDIKDSSNAAEALDELQVRLKGSAQGYAQTFAGQSEILKEKVGNMIEDIGGKLLPVLTKLLEHIEPIVDKIVDWMGKHDKLTSILVIGAGAIGLLLTVLGPLLIALPAIVTGIQAVGAALIFLSANPIVLIIAAIVALVAAIVLMITHWQQTKTIALQVWNEIKEVVGGAMETVKNYIGAGMTYIQTVWMEVWTAIKDYVLAIWQEIVDKITGFVNGIMDKINSVKNAISSVASAVGNTVSSVGNKIGNAFGGGKASGGTVFAGSAYVVGEQGPELFLPGVSGTIIPNGGIGGTVINVNFSRLVLISLYLVMYP
jgi:hypothetical protein